MKRFFPAVSIVALAVIGASSARAQNATEPLAGVLQAPPTITNIVSIDAHNVLLVESQTPGAPNEPKQYSLFVPRHIYSGGLARLFGGSIIPTEVLVIPESARRSSFAAPSVSPGVGGNGNINNGNINNGNMNNGNMNNGNMNNGFNNGYNNFNNTGNVSNGNVNASNSFNRSFPLYAPRIPFIK